MIDLICISHQLLQYWVVTEVWKGEERMDSDHRMVVAMLERKERVKKWQCRVVSNVRVWRPRDLSYWDQLRLVSDLE